MGIIVKLDERGRLVIPADLRASMKTDYVEISAEGDKLMLVPIPDPLEALRSRVSRAKPPRDLSIAAEEEAERLVREGRGNADS